MEDRTTKRHSDPLRKSSCLLVLLTVGLSACGPISQEELDELLAERDGIAANLETAQSDLGEAEGKIAEQAARMAELEEETRVVKEERQAARDTVDQLTERVAQLEFTAGAALAELESAIANFQAVLIAFDPQIRAARETLQSAVEQELCERQLEETEALPVRDTADEIVFDNPELLASLAGFPVGALLDLEALAELRDQCFAEATIRGPKGDGIYVVADEILVGVWQSTGDSRTCYWARLDSDWEIIDSYFGRAGGQLEISADDTRVQLAGCGSWYYVGT